MNLTVRIFGIKVATIRDETPPQPAEAAASVQYAVVADNDINRTNEFWKARIGETGIVVAERGGMWDVHFPQDPFPCKDLDPQRFTFKLT